MPSLEELRKTLRSGDLSNPVEPEFEPNFGIDPANGDDIFWRSIDDHYSYRLGGGCAMIIHAEIAKLEGGHFVCSKLTKLILERSGRPVKKGGAHWELASDLARYSLQHYRMNFGNNNDDATEWIYVENKIQRGEIPMERRHPGLRVKVMDDDCFYAWEHDGDHGDSKWVDVDGSEV